MRAADFYTGLVAEMYSPLKSGSYSWPAYAEFIRARGEPALELGCGDGDPMLDLLRAGFDVDGVDSSPDMLDRFRSAADAEGLAASLHCQRMEELDLPRRYRSIFLAGPTILLLPEDEAVVETLRRIRAHLAPGGAALVPLWIPEPASAEEIGQTREASGDDGALLRLTLVSQDRDEHSRTQRTVLRYVRRRGDVVEVEEREWLLHWHPRAGFTELAARAGLHAEIREGETREDETREDGGEAASPDSPGSSWSVLLTHP